MSQHHSRFRDADGKLDPSKFDPHLKAMWDNIPADRRDELDRIIKAMDANISDSPGKAIMQAGAIAIALAVDPHYSVYGDIAHKSTRLLLAGATATAFEMVLEIISKGVKDKASPTNLMAAIVDAMQSFHNKRVDEANTTREQLANLIESVSPEMLREKEAIKEARNARGQ